MIKEKYVTKEYFYSEIQEIRSTMRIMLDTALKSTDAYHEKIRERQTGTLQESLRDDLRGVTDGITMLMEKSENHEGRICKIEEVMI